MHRMLSDIIFDRLVSYLMKPKLRLSLIILRNVNPIKEYGRERWQTQTLLIHQLTEKRQRKHTDTKHTGQSTHSHDHNIDRNTRLSWWEQSGVNWLQREASVSSPWQPQVRMRGDICSATPPSPHSAAYTTRLALSFVT